MPARYVVVQYVPDIIADERINIGVLAFDLTAVECRFLKDWSRVERFAGKDISFAKDLAHDFEQACNHSGLLEIAGEKRLDVETIKLMVETWGHNIQLTEPRGSLRGRHELLQQMSSRLLVEPEPRSPRHLQVRTRAQARSIVVDRLAIEAKTAFPLAFNKLFHTKYQRQGCEEIHTPDASLANGHALMSVHAISMEPNHGWQEETAKIKWMVSDLMKVKAAAPVALLVLPPKGKLDEYKAFTKTVRNVGATVLEEDGINQSLAALVDQTVPEKYKISIK